jgi:hypothetical protein
VVKICEAAGVLTGNLSARGVGSMLGNLGLFFSGVNKRNRIGPPELPRQT